MRSVELFSGAGGLALGTAQAGFDHELLVEWDDRAHETLILNKQNGLRHVRDWKIEHEDADQVDYAKLVDGIDLVAGGPPCQPFSIGGKHKGPEDYRDMWPVATKVVRELKPRAFLFENVRGLTRPTFAEYLRYIMLGLEWPGIAPKKGEPWSRHLGRLEKHARKAGDTVSSRYRVHLNKVNAADYGVPQKRHRVIIVGFRDDLGIDWEFPAKTHSRERLVWDQLVSGDYWRERGIPRTERPEPSKQDLALARKLEAKGERPEQDPWVTVRDKLGDLPEPYENGEGVIPNHLFQPGARTYVGHTGSPLDQPAKALKAGDHGVPGGENMLARHDGTVRYFSVREAARLQCFPDDFLFPGAWTVSLRQLGNAVPVTLAKIIANSIANSLRSLGNVNQNRRAA